MISKPQNNEPRLSESRSQCTACGDLFNSTSVFDKHRVGAFETPDAPSQRRCLTPVEMEGKGWLRNGAGFWIRAAHPGATPALEGPRNSMPVAAAGVAL